MNDTERLDWLEKHGWTPNPSFHYGNLEVNLDLPWTRAGSSDSVDLRVAIDLMAEKWAEEASWPLV